MPIFVQYRYQPLSGEDAIRLIVLNPSRDKEAPLSCSIVQHRRSTTQNVTYSAVSYAWGLPEFTKKLEVKCDVDVSYLSITPTVDTLLRYLRSPNRTHRLWIDALCLNQADEMERAQQIPMMGRIYEEAERVHIWLGPANRMTAKLFGFFREASSFPEVEKREMAIRVVFSLSKHCGSDGFCGQQSLFQFSERAWFCRRWVIQEACLARQAILHCGRHGLPLPTLVKAAARYQTLDVSSYPIKVMANLSRPTAGLNMLKLLWTFQESDCMEPKDRIAAFLGLNRDARSQNLHLDYTSHWTRIYRDLAFHLLALSDNDISLQVLLHSFEFGPISRPEDPSYPSWVPDWSRARQRDLPYHSLIKNPDTHEHYPTSPGNTNKARVIVNCDSLTIIPYAPLGRHPGGHVTRALKLDSPPKSEDECPERVLSILEDILPSTSERKTEIFALFLLLEKILGFQDRNAGRQSSMLHSENSSQHPTELLHISSACIKRLDYLLQEHCLFSLEPFDPGNRAGGMYGIGPQQMDTGDVMIPIWQLEWRDQQKGSRVNEDVAQYTTTMLSVRPTIEGTVQSHSNEPGTARRVSEGKIIGPAVCVEFYEQGNKQDDVIIGNWDNQSSGEQPYMMRLL